MFRFQFRGFGYQPPAGEYTCFGKGTFGPPPIFLQCNKENNLQQLDRKIHTYLPRVTEQVERFFSAIVSVCIVTKGYL